MENNQFKDLITENPALNPVIELIEQIMSIPEESLTKDSIDMIIGMLTGAFTDKIKEDSITNITQEFENQSYTHAEAERAVSYMKVALNALLDELQTSELRRKVLDSTFEVFYGLFEQALERYHSYNINLPIQLEVGAKVPTYAHSTDACADLYAADDMTLPAHSFGNMIRTGVHIALPEGWMAMIFPRSSIGAKTQNRLSNSVGIIDSEYRGQLGVLYDNFSDSDYEIKAGDRVAQMLVMPSYKFKPNVVDILPASDRGEGGFGSTGK